MNPDVHHNFHGYEIDVNHIDKSGSYYFIIWDFQETWSKGEIFPCPESALQGAKDYIKERDIKVYLAEMK